MKSITKRIQLSLLLLSIFLFCIPSVLSIEGKMPLLAVSITEEGEKGNTAELFLEIKDGTGRVFVDTFPLSKLDTQISMRFAKEIACDFIEKNCNNKDFIYTIRASSPIIGGPSAGAAATVLTVALLSETKINEKIALTGTINSGGLIGHVGGLKSKIEAGKGILEKVLIPEGDQQNITLNDNSTTTLVKLGKSLNITVIEISDLNSALKIFTGKTFKKDNENIKISDFYEKTMKKLAEDLCERNEKFNKVLRSYDLDEEKLKLYNEGKNLSNKKKLAFKNNNFYAAASYCFGSNVKLNQVFVEEKNFSTIKYKSLLKELIKKIIAFEKKMDLKEIKTITDLESYMIVKERLAEAMKYANSTDNSSISYSYAYANERLFSALSWSEFFSNSGKFLEMDKESLKESSKQRIAEAEERLQYTNLYLPFNLNSPREEIKRAYNDFNSEKYALALFKATKAKSEANIVLNTIGITPDYFPRLLENKLNAAARVIANAEKKGTFPVLGYSYYEYANNLKESDVTSALLYAEYALEMSNLDIYFKEKQSSLINMNWEKFTTFMLGGLLGLTIGFIIGKIDKKEQTGKRKSKKSKKQKR